MEGRGYLLLILICICGAVTTTLGQITYFEQGFDGAGPYANTPPSIGQFDKLVQTNTSSYAASNGALELTRAQNPVPQNTSGLVRAVRSTAFSPNPETLYIQMTLSARDISTVTSNALYFYVGENFNPDNNSIPSNLLLFSRISLNFDGIGVVVRDLQTNVNSTPIGPNTSFTLTWVLNNSPWGQVYKFPETAPVANYKVMPYRYDLWVNGLLLVDEASAYPPPGSGVPNSYSPTRLSNFEIRYRDGFGTIGIDYLLIRDIDGVLPIYISNFEASQFQEQVRLEWTVTLQENMPDTYLVQRSVDGYDFTTIGTVSGQGSIGYQYVDSIRVGGRFFYRIMALDIQGRVIETTLRRTLFLDPADDLIFVYDNPVKAGVLQVYDGGMGQDFRLCNVSGIEIPFTSRRGVGGELLIDPISPLPAGIYLLGLRYRGKNQSLRVAVP